MLKQTVVKVTKAGPGWVEYEDPSGDSWTVGTPKFEGAQAGQSWLVVTEHDNRYPAGSVVGATRLPDALEKKSPELRFFEGCMLLCSALVVSLVVVVVLGALGALR